MAEVCQINEKCLNSQVLNNDIYHTFSNDLRFKNLKLKFLKCHDGTLKYLFLEK